MCSTNYGGSTSDSASKLLTLPKELIQIPDRERQTYDVQFKVSVACEAELTSNRKAAAKFGISEANVRRWRKSLPTLLKNNDMSLGPGFRGPKQGRFEVIEIILIEYINSVMSKGIPISKKGICEKATEIARVTSIEDFEATEAWCNNFLLRHELYNSVTDESEDCDNSNILDSINNSVTLNKMMKENDLQPSSSSNELQPDIKEESDSSERVQEDSVCENETSDKDEIVVKEEIEDNEDDTFFKCDQFCEQKFDDGNGDDISSDKNSKDESGDTLHQAVPERQRQAYDANFKISIVREAESTSNGIVAMKYGISETNIRRWKKVMPLLLTTELDRKTFRGPKKGRFEEIEKILTEEMNVTLKQGGKLRPIDIRLKAKLIGELFNVEEFKASKSWCYRFLKRNGFSASDIDEVSEGKSIDEDDEDDVDLDEDD